MRGVPHPPPPIEAVIDLTIRCGAVTNPGIRPVGISVNTGALDENAARDCLRRLEDAHMLPASDPMRFGMGEVVNRIAADFPATLLSVAG